MNKSHIELLDKNYKDACEEILKAFCKTYELPYEKDSWTAVGVGTYANVGDFYIDMQDMLFMLNNNISWNVWLANYDYNMDAAYLGLNLINLQSWCRNAPRLSKEQMDNLKAMRKELEELTEEYNKKF
jgi:hypothetical protein